MEKKSRKINMIKRIVGYLCVCIPVLFLIIITILVGGWTMLYIWGFAALIAGCVIIGAYLIEEN